MLRRKLLQAVELDTRAGSPAWSFGSGEPSLRPLLGARTNVEFGEASSKCSRLVRDSIMPEALPNVRTLKAAEFGS